MIRAAVQCERLQVELMNALIDVVENGGDHDVTARVEVDDPATGEEVVDLAMGRLRKWLGGFTFQQGARFGVWKEAQSPRSVEVRLEENGGCHYVVARVLVDSAFPMPEVVE